jgi:hypothetical protein
MEHDGPFIIKIAPWFPSVVISSFLTFRLRQRQRMPPKPYFALQRGLGNKGDQTSHSVLARKMAGTRYERVKEVEDVKDVNGTHPVEISSKTQPIDQISAAPNFPFRSVGLIISGAIYIGVPASEFITAGPSAPGAFVRIARVLAIVRLPFAITLAAPKSTNLIVELVPRRISVLVSY